MLVYQSVFQEKTSVKVGAPFGPYLSMARMARMVAPLKTNEWHWKIPIFNRKYIDSFMVDFPASHVSFRAGGVSQLNKPHGTHIKQPINLSPNSLPTTTHDCTHRIPPAPKLSPTPPRTRTRPPEIHGADAGEAPKENCKKKSLWITVHAIYCKSTNKKKTSNYELWPSR